MSNYPVTYYRYSEERLNVITHGLGFLLTVAGTVLLITFSSLRGTAWHIVGFSIFGASMMILYAASTSYHYVSTKSIRKILNKFDHAAIYLLIAGTYTPFCLAAIRGAMGWVLFGLVWGFALIGIIFKIKYAGRFNRMSTLLYVLMGWLAVIAYGPLIENLPPNSLWYLVAGGLSYTVGAGFYLAEKLKFHHSIFHLWVLLGTILHFFSVMFILPS